MAKLKRSVEPLSPDVTADQILTALRRLESPYDREGMARFGIQVDNALGISVSTLRSLGKNLRRRHDIALALWPSGLHEARILATIVADPGQMTSQTADHWVRDLDSWDLCDQFCMNLMRETDLAWDKAFQWCRREETFIKRAGFSLMATLAVRDKAAADKIFLDCLAEIRRASGDDRNFVKKAVNWVLRQIGKRNASLHPAALALAEELAASPDEPARWIGRDAARELTSEPVRKRLGLD